MLQDGQLAEAMRAVDGGGVLKVTAIYATDGTVSYNYRWLTALGKEELVRRLRRGGLDRVVQVRGQTECPDGWWIRVMGGDDGQANSA